MADKWEGERLENARLLEEEKAAARYINALLKIKEKSKEETKGMVERRYSFLPFFLYHSFSIPLTLGFIYFLLFPFSLALDFQLRPDEKCKRMILNRVDQHLYVILGDTLPIHNYYEYGFQQF